MVERLIRFFEAERINSRPPLEQTELLDEKASNKNGFDNES